MYKIEVDEEVYRFLQSRAEPFVDTENSVLRRLLLGKTKPIPGGTDIKFPNIPRGTPDGLRYILEIIYLIEHGQVSDRTEATKKVADRHNIKYPTVADKYTRQLGKSAYDFERMLDEPEFNELKVTLKEKFNIYSPFIDKFFEELPSTNQMSLIINSESKKSKNSNIV